MKKDFLIVFPYNSLSSSRGMTPAIHWMSIMRQTSQSEGKEPANCGLKSTGQSECFADYSFALSLVLAPALFSQNDSCLLLQLAWYIYTELTGEVMSLKAKT